MADHREPQYNLSELAILRSLEADIRTSFKGHVFSEPINLLGLKRGQILDLTGAVFTEPVAVLTSTPSRVIIDEAQFFQGLVLQVNTDILSANGAITRRSTVQPLELTKSVWKTPSSLSMTPGCTSQKRPTISVTRECVKRSSKQIPCDASLHAQRMTRTW